jgi:hypothetical protein
MEEAPENGKELSYSAHVNGMNELMNIELLTKIKGNSINKVYNLWWG